MVLEKAEVCRHIGSKKGRKKEEENFLSHAVSFSLSSWDAQEYIPVPFANKGDTNELIMRKRGGGFSEERRWCNHRENQLSSQSLPEFSTIWLLGRSRGDKDKGTTNRPGWRKRGTITLPYRAHNVRTLICIRFLAAAPHTRQDNGDAPDGHAITNRRECSSYLYFIIFNNFQ